jgi:hypothetical protein
MRVVAGGVDDPEIGQIAGELMAAAHWRAMAVLK